MIDYKFFGECSMFQIDWQLLLNNLLQGVGIAFTLFWNILQAIVNNPIGDIVVIVGIVVLAIRLFWHQIQEAL